MIAVSAEGRERAEERRLASLAKSTVPGGEYAGRGIHEGPHYGMAAGEMEPGDHTRPYISEGHAADSPQNTEPHMQPVPYVDLRASRGVVRAMAPHHFPPTPRLPGDHQ